MRRDLADGGAKLKPPSNWTRGTEELEHQAKATPSVKKNLQYEQAII